MTVWLKKDKLSTSQLTIHILFIFSQIVNHTIRVRPNSQKSLFGTAVILIAILQLYLNCPFTGEILNQWCRSSDAQFMQALTALSQREDFPHNLSSDSYIICYKIRRTEPMPWNVVVHRWWLCALPQWHIQLPTWLPQMFSVIQTQTLSHTHIQRPTDIHTEEVTLRRHSEWQWLPPFLISSDRTCIVPHTHNTSDNKSFAAASPQVWNNLPSYLGRDISYGQLKWQLKIFLSGVNGPRRIVTVCFFVP